MKTMKTPDEIKRGLLCCAKTGCVNCLYEKDCDSAVHGGSVAAQDALAYIEMLETDMDELEAEREALKHKAAIYGELCTICKHNGKGEREAFCIVCAAQYDSPCKSCRASDGLYRRNYEWKGDTP